MSGYTGYVEAYRDAPDGGEVTYRLKYRGIPYRPETRWEPAEFGVEAEAVYRDGEYVEWPDVPADVMEELLVSADDEYRERNDAWA